MTSAIERARSLVPCEKVACRTTTQKPSDLLCGNCQLARQLAALLTDIRREAEVEAQEVAEIAQLIEREEQLGGLTEAMYHALRSYEHGNTAPELARELCAKYEIEKAALEAERRKAEQ